MTARSSSVDELAARARAGDRRATARLRRRLEQDARGLAMGLAGSRRQARRLVRGAMAEALRDTERPFASAVLIAISHAAPADAVTGASPEQRLQQAVGVLVDLQGRTHADAAALLHLPVERVRALHREGREELGLADASTDCHGWHLVSRLDELTAPEQAAGRRHLDGCRRCTDALEARAAARHRLRTALPVGGTAVGALAVAGFSSLSGGAATTAAVVGAVGTVTAGVVSVPVVIHERPPRPAVVQQASASHSDALHTVRASRRPAAPRPSASPTALPGRTPTTPVAVSAPSPAASPLLPVPVPVPSPSLLPSPSPLPGLLPSPSPATTTDPATDEVPAPALLGVVPPLLDVLPSLLPTPTTTASPSPTASPAPTASPSRGNNGNGHGNGHGPDKYRGHGAAAMTPSPTASASPSPEPTAPS